MRRVFGFSLGAAGALVLVLALPPSSVSTGAPTLAPPPGAPPVEPLARSRRAGDPMAPAGDGELEIAPPVARHVIIISEDGLRPDALAHARPPVHEAVMRRGAYSLAARTIRQASTLPSHAAMLSGFDAKQHGLTWNSWQPARGYIQVPTVFDAVGRAGGGAAAFVGKWKLQHIAQPGSVEVFSRPGYFCRKVVEPAARYFTERRPQVEFVHFSDPDETGHAIGWMSAAQMDAVRRVDRCLGTLVDAVERAGMEEDTLFILSADHGGHGRGHSGAVDADRLIPWIAWGAGVKRGHVIVGPVSTVDTAATALWALGYPPPPGLAGKPVREAFVR